MNTYGKDMLRIAIVIHQLSSEQLKELGAHLRSLPVQPHVLLINQVPKLPILFYRLWETRTIEADLIQTARLELSKAAQDLGVLANSQIVRGSHISCVIRELPKDIDHLIGHDLKKPGTFFLSRSVATFSVEAWISAYGCSHAPIKAMLPKQPIQTYSYPLIQKALFSAAMLKRHKPLETISLQLETKHPPC